MHLYSRKEVSVVTTYPVFIQVPVLFFLKKKVLQYMHIELK